MLPVNPRIYVTLKTLNSILLTLTGYSFGVGESFTAIVIASLYAGCKTLVENTEPKT